MKRDKKAIINNIEKLVKKYGYDNTRLTINRYFQMKKEEKDHLNRIKEAEKNLIALKKRKV